jgi:hypothetical protein
VAVQVAVDSQVAGSRAVAANRAGASRAAVADASAPPITSRVGGAIAPPTGDSPR